MMPQGLLAQWQRGIALRGVAGALLLMVPVVIAATIGFGGGVGVGLSSALSGPTDNTVQSNSTPGSRDRSSASLDQLAAAISPVVNQTDPKKTPLGVPSGGSPTSPGGGSGPVAPPPSTGASSGASTESAAQADPGITSGGGGASATPAPTNPLTSSNPVADLLNALLGGGSSSP
jgi:hypothetical protein